MEPSKFDAVLGGGNPRLETGSVVLGNAHFKGPKIIIFYDENYLLLVWPDTLYALLAHKGLELFFEVKDFEVQKEFEDIRMGSAIYMVYVKYWLRVPILSKQDRLGPSSLPALLDAFEGQVQFSAYKQSIPQDRLDLSSPARLIETCNLFLPKI